MNRIYLRIELIIFMIVYGLALKLFLASVRDAKLIIIYYCELSILFFFSCFLIILFFLVIFFAYYNNIYSVVYSIIFCLLIDIVYIHILGIYMFTYAMTIYIIKKLTRLFHSNLASTLLLGILGIVLA